MEALLALSFSNMTSTSPAKIRRGLRHTEGLLAQLCLDSATPDSAASSSSSSPSKRRTSAAPSDANGGASGTARRVVPGGRREDGDGDGDAVKTLDVLGRDLAFREFFRLQESFEWNVPTRSITCLERLLGMGSSPQNDALILSTLHLLQGTLLLHPPSRTLFRLPSSMTLLLDLLDASSPPAIQSQALLVLVTAMLGVPGNTRCFEAVGGLATVTSMLKRKGRGGEGERKVKMGAVEFLYFYLMAETPAPASMPEDDRGNPTPATAILHRASDGAAEEQEQGGGLTRSTEQKTKMLSRYLSNVEDLVGDLREGAAF
ncbi:cell division protein Cdc14 [Cryomyces antarcticus]